MPGLTCTHVTASSWQESGPIISFDFRKLHFILDGEDLTFRKLKYPTKVPGAFLHKIKQY